MCTQDVYDIYLHRKLIGKLGYGASCFSRPVIRGSQLARILEYLTRLELSVVRRRGQVALHLHGVELNGQTVYFEDLRGKHVVLSLRQADAFARALASAHGSGANGGTCRDKLSARGNGCFLVVQ